MNPTYHYIINADCRALEGAPPLQLIVTSPPYPGIALWDDLFQGMGILPESPTYFQDTLEFLNGIWKLCYHWLSPGGIIVINVADAIRKLHKNLPYEYYPTASAIQMQLQAIGFRVKPPIYWNKVTNRPNKFLGTLLPCNSPVSIEIEQILIAQKGGNRKFDSLDETIRRRDAALFFKERNEFFSQIWTFPGDNGAMRASYPLELPYRIISMFSVPGDFILDPFGGSGTTTVAAISLGRNSICTEISKQVFNTCIHRVAGSLGDSIKRQALRKTDFVESGLGLESEHRNKCFDIPVKTAYEINLQICAPCGLTAEPVPATYPTIRFQAAYQALGKDPGPNDLPFEPDPE